MFEWPEGSKYVGEFHNNEIEGWGRYDWPDGRAYCGQWMDNKMHGFGWFFWFNGQIYRGQYDQVRNRCSALIMNFKKDAVATSESSLCFFKLARRRTAF